MFTWYHPNSPLCSVLSDHLCQRDERVKDSSDRTVFFDTHFHSSKSRLQYSSESLFQGFSTQSHIRLSFSSTPVPLTPFRLGFLRAPGVLLCPQRHLQPEFQRSSAPPTLVQNWWFKASGALWIIWSCLNQQAFMKQAYGCWHRWCFHQFCSLGNPLMPGQPCGETAKGRKMALVEERCFRHQNGFPDVHQLLPRVRKITQGLDRLSAVFRSLDTGNNILSALSSFGVTRRKVEDPTTKLTGSKLMNRNNRGVSACLPI